jgi:hypothetical protein
MIVNATLALSALVALTLRGAERKWPSIITFLLLRVVSGFALLSTASNYSEYFYTYWTCAGLQFICQFWLLYQVCQDVLSGFPFVPKGFPKLMAVGMAAAALLSIWISTQTQGTFADRIVALSVGMQRTALMAWCASFLVCAISTSWLGLAWKRDTILIASGSVAMNASDMVASLLYGILTIKHSAVVDNVSTMIELSVLFLWLVSLKPAIDERTEKLPDPASIESLKAIAQSTLGVSNT